MCTLQTRSCRTIIIWIFDIDLWILISNGWGHGKFHKISPTNSLNTDQSVKYQSNRWPMKNFASLLTLLISIIGQNCKSITYLDLEKWNLITSQIKLLLAYKVFCVICDIFIIFLFMDKPFSLSQCYILHL